VDPFYCFTNDVRGSIRDEYRWTEIGCKVGFLVLELELVKWWTVGVEPALRLVLPSLVRVNTVSVLFEGSRR
jgi:hypothetical protein